MDLNVGEGFTSLDPSGRSIVVLPGAKGNMVFFDRFGDRTGPVVVNGFATDLVSSWDGNDKACSGWRVDNDQFAEQLLKRLEVPASVPKRTYVARLEKGENNAEGMETHKVFLTHAGALVAMLSITLKQHPTLPEYTAVIMDEGKFYDQYSNLRPALCLMGMEAFLKLHPLDATKPLMYYGESLLLEVTGSLSLVCEQDEDMPGLYIATGPDHNTLIDGLRTHGFQVRPE
jgi:hypothetical protein